MDLLEALTQYCEIRQEAKDLRYRIEQTQRRLQKIKEEGAVSDTVTGTRKDGTIGPIKITGFPDPEYDAVKGMLKKRVAKLGILENDLLEALNLVDDYISQIPSSKLRQIFRIYYEDDLTWRQTAREMNRRFPKKQIPYTEDSCRKLHDRYLEKERNDKRT